jgi:hypothetical protein
MKHYLSLSGGAHSVAAAILMAERGVDFEMVFADTGVELPETYWILPRVAKELDRKLIVISNGTFYQYLTLYGYMLPGMMRRWCTRLLKQDPQRKFFQGQDCLVSIGICADEAHRMEPSPTRNPGYEFDRPLVDAGIGKDEAEAMCSRRGLLSPVYEWRSSTSCFCCPFQRKHDWLNLSKKHPDLFALAEDWEAWSMQASNGYTWNEGYTLKQLREADQAQIDLLPECTERACVICEV